MKKQFYIFIGILISFIIRANSQTLDPNKIEFKTYFKKSSQTPQGIAVSMLYPSTYQIIPDSHYPEITGFTESINSNRYFKLGVEDISGLLSAEPIVSSVINLNFFRQLIPVEYEELLAKNNFLVYGCPAGFIDYKWSTVMNLGSEVKRVNFYNRIYKIKCWHFLISLSFSYAILESEDNAKKGLTDFYNDSMFYSYILNSLVFSE